MKSWCAWFAMGVTFLACSSGSSSSGGGTCGTVSACGGDIVGTWKVVDACAGLSSSSTTNGTCTGETVQVGSYTANGTITFNADMTYAVSVTQSFSETATLPASCLMMNGITVTCDELTAALNETTQADAGAGMTTCTAAGSSCNCTIALSGLSTTEMGTYTLSGDTFSTTSSAAGTTSSSTTGYCVQGNTLHIISSVMGSTGMTTANEDFVATKE
jgi:hypothetical protein